MNALAKFERLPTSYQAVVIEALLALDAATASAPAIEPIKVREIARAACQAFEVTYLDLISKRRHRSIAYVRAAVCWVARHVTTMSLPQIAAALDGCDHSTVLHRIDLADRLIRDREPYARAVLEIIESVMKETRQ